MEKENLSIPEKLFNYFIGNNNLTANYKSEKNIIVGNSKSDVERKTKDLFYQEEARNKFFNTTQRGYQKSLQFEAARLPAYLDYEGMEYYPIISSALDLLMEESTIIGENGKMLNIFSSKQRIKDELENFFYYVINVNTTLPFWTRNMPIRHDSMIPLLDGTEITIKELSEKLKNNPDEDIWTYSIQDNTNAILPGKIVWCDLTRKKTQLVRVNLDDGTYVETTPDHEFLLRSGKQVKASELNSGDSLMPFYTIESNEGSYLKGYEKVYNPATNHHKFTHRLVSQELLRDKKNESKISDRIVTHHLDFNKKNNTPKNLKRMSNTEHSTFHGKHGSEILNRKDVVEKRMKGIDLYLRSDKRKKYLSEKMKGKYPKYFKDYNNSKFHNEHNKNRSESMFNHWSDDNYRKNTQKLMQINLSDKCFDIIKNYILTSDEYLSKTKLGEILKRNKEFINEFKKTNKLKRNLNKSLNSHTINSMILRKTGLDYMDFYLSINKKIELDKEFIRINKIRNSKKSTTDVLNHKVVSVEYLDTLDDVYCMEVLGENGEHDRHNFPICSKDKNGKYTRNGIFVSNCKYGDNFVLTYGERNKGIVAVNQLVNYEIERMDKIFNGQNKTMFKNRITGDEYNTYDVAHFRLLGDDKFIPYGSSILNKVRRVFRQLVMAEDAMLTYRLLRAGDRRVFKIDVGNMEDDAIEPYIAKVATKFKRTPSVNVNDGQIDYKFNIIDTDEDIYLPVRNANVQTGVDVMEGAKNLNDIEDIEYLRDNLFMGLGIPKPFLSFQDASGGGKNMAQFDVRFTKKINRIQQALIQELNKMAIVHLILLGYDKKDINFTLTLSNPSTHNEIQKIDLLKEKADLYKTLTSGDEGIAAMSTTKAKKILFNMSDHEIISDLNEQKIEQVIKNEISDATENIKRSTIFDDLDKKFGEASVDNIFDKESSDNNDMEMGSEKDQESVPSDNNELPNQSISDLPDIEDDGTLNEYGDFIKIISDRKKIKKLIKDDYNLSMNKKGFNLLNEIEKYQNNTKI